MRYVLEGSIRPVAELFAIMDDVVDGLVMTLCSNLGMAEAKRAARQRPEDLQAWALCVQAEAYAFQPGAEVLAAEEKLARQAADIEPGYRISWALLAAVTAMRIFAGAIFAGPVRLKTATMCWR